jgi:hypothetical protein
MALYIYDLHIKYEDGCYRPRLERLLRYFTVFRTFFSLLTDINLIFGTLLCHSRIQIKFEFGFHPLIFHEVMTLELRKISRTLSFRHFFFDLLTDIYLLFGRLLCHTKMHSKFEFGFDPLIFCTLVVPLHTCDKF